MSYTVINGVVVPVRSIAELTQVLEEKADANR